MSAPRTTPRRTGNPSPIAAARMAAGLTQAQLAAQVGCTQKDVSRWETGARQPNAVNACKLAGILGCDVSQLINA